MSSGTHFHHHSSSSSHHSSSSHQYRCHMSPSHTSRSLYCLTSSSITTSTLKTSMMSLARSEQKRATPYTSMASPYSIRARPSTTSSLNFTLFSQTILGI